MNGFDSVSIYTKLVTAGTSACIADAVTFPLDTAKVRLQIQGEAPGVVRSGASLLTSPALNQVGLFGTLKNMIQSEGPRY